MESILHPSSEMTRYSAMDVKVLQIKIQTTFEWTVVLDWT